MTKKRRLLVAAWVATIVAAIFCIWTLVVFNGPRVKRAALADRSPLRCSCEELAKVAQWTDVTDGTEHRCYVRIDVRDPARIKVVGPDGKAWRPQ